VNGDLRSGFRSVFWWMRGRRYGACVSQTLLADRQCTLTAMDERQRIANAADIARGRLGRKMRREVGHPHLYSGDVASGRLYGHRPPLSRACTVCYRLLGPASRFIAQMALEYVSGMDIADFNQRIQPDQDRLCGMQTSITRARRDGALRDRRQHGRETSTPQARPLENEAKG
jgi:hypothetical protein